MWESPEAKYLPNPPDPKQIQLRIDADYWNIIRQRLSGNHPIKRVLMRPSKPSSTQTILD